MEILPSFTGEYVVPKGAMWIAAKSLVVPTYAQFFEATKKREIGLDYLSGLLTPETPSKSVPKPPSRMERTKAALARATGTGRNTHAYDHVVELGWVELFTSWCRLHEGKNRCHCGRRADVKYCSPRCQNRAVTLRGLRARQNAHIAFLDWLWGFGAWWEPSEYSDFTGLDVEKWPPDGHQAESCPKCRYQAANEPWTDACHSPPS